MRASTRFLLWLVAAMALTTAFVVAIQVGFASGPILRSRIALVGGLSHLVDSEQDAQRLSDTFGYPIHIVATGSLPEEVQREVHAHGASAQGTVRSATLYLPLRPREVLVVGPLPPSDLPVPQMLMMTALFALGLGGLSYVLLVRPMAARIEALQRATRSFRDGAFSVRAPADGTDDLAALATTFNEMADRIQELVERQQHLLRAVAHELRTPIARIRFDLELLDRDAVETSLEELEGLISEVLELIRSDRPPEDLPSEPILLGEVVDEVIAQLAPLHPEIRFRVEGEQTALVPGPWRIVRRSLANVLGNAAAHAQTRVQVTLRSAPDGVRAHVDDDGSGVALADRQRIFEPFVRLDDSRSRARGGSGLGLALVRKAMAWQRGTVTVEDGPLGGARFSLCWPP
jgi:two-component system sensor histidine kinase RstB